MASEIRDWMLRIIPCALWAAMSADGVVAQSVAAAAPNPLGASWNSLAALPNLLNAQWIPENAPADEFELLKTLNYPPLRPEYTEDATAQVTRLLRREDPLSTDECRADGQPRLAWYPYPLRFIYGAGNVMIEVAYQVRQIPVTGLQHPANLNDQDAIVSLQPNGDARGLWEGDTLVVDTIASREDIDFFYGVPHDPELHIVERYRLISADRLERVSTIEAPNTLVAPWVVRTTYKRAPAGSYASIYCEPKGGWFIAYRNAKAAVIPKANAGGERRYTPAMTWDSIQKLPAIWGKAWQSPQEYDATQIVLSALKYPPFKSEYLRRSQAQVKKILNGKAEFKQASCAPNGMTRVLWYTTAPVFLFQPGDRLILAQFGEFREIWMDGRPHPARLDPNEPAIKYNGHSIGWWEGEDLLIDTVGVHPGHELFYGVAYGPGMHVRERYHLLDADHLQMTATVEAPVVLAKPWVFTRNYFAGSAGTAGPGTLPAGNGGGAASSACTPTDSRQKVDAAGNVFLNLTPPKPGIR